MKNIIRALAGIIFLAGVLSYNGCGSDAVVGPSNTGNGTTTGASQSFTSTSGGTFTYEGFNMIIRNETVPRQQNGSPGTVVFSMSTSSSLPSGLPNLPSGYTASGKFLNAGPEGFTFNYTVRLTFSGASESNPSNLRVMGYFPETNDWRLIPSYVIDGQNKIMAIDVLKLGWFVLVKSSTVTDVSVTPQGGFECCSNDGLTFYIVTVKSAVFADPGVSSSYASGLIGATFVSPNISGMVFPSDVCRGIVPLGTYEFWVSTRKFNEDIIYTYSLPATVTISNSLNWPLPWVYNGGEGWTHFCVPAGGTWVQGRPGSWPQPTVPYGSGVLQATLTWSNTSSSAADMDLHLYGPNGIHIYYNNQTTNDFKLDRDWQSTVGSATENIYSLNSTMPSGAYSVKVVHYSGAEKTFTARTVLNGAVTNYTGTLAGNQTEVTVKTFTIP